MSDERQSDENVCNLACDISLSMLFAFSCTPNRARFTSRFLAGNRTNLHLPMYTSLLRYIRLVFLTNLIRFEGNGQHAPCRLLWTRMEEKASALLFSSLQQQRRPKQQTHT